MRKKLLTDLYWALILLYGIVALLGLCLAFLFWQVTQLHVIPVGEVLP